MKYSIKLPYLPTSCASCSLAVPIEHTWCCTAHKDRLSVEQAMMGQYRIAQCPITITDEYAMLSILRSIREEVWGYDIESPTCPEYREHHESIQKILKFIDKEIVNATEDNKTIPDLPKYLNDMPRTANQQDLGPAPREPGLLLEPFDLVICSICKQEKQRNSTVTQVDDGSIVCFNCFDYPTIKEEQ